MTIQLKSRGMSTSKSLQEYVSKRLDNTLAHWSNQLRSVVVRLADVNGPKGGVDKTCAIQVSGPMGAPVVVQATAANFFTAIDMASKRAERVIQRAFERMRAPK